METAKLSSWERGAGESPASSPQEPRHMSPRYLKQIPWHLLKAETRWDEGATQYRKEQFYSTC